MIIPWSGKIKPFCVYGNLYFVGTVPASAHLIDTGAGLILLDVGFPQSLHQVIESIWELGFDPRNIKYIVNSHGHYDHLGATRTLVEMTGAKTFLGREDADYANGKVNLTWADELGYHYYEHDYFQPDVLLDEGSLIELGNTSIRCKHTPGHTPGTMSFFFKVHGSDGDKVAGMFGGSGLNTQQKKFLDKYPFLYGMRAAFRKSILALLEEKVDIHIGNHVDNNDTVERGKAVLAGKADAFIDPENWQKFLYSKLQEFDELEANEKQGL